MIDQRLGGVLGACGQKTALAADQRRQRRLVGPERPEDKTIVDSVRHETAPGQAGRLPSTVVKLKPTGRVAMRRTDLALHAPPPPPPRRRAASRRVGRGNP